MFLFKIIIELKNQHTKNKRNTRIYEIGVRYDGTVGFHRSRSLPVAVPWCTVRLRQRGAGVLRKARPLGEAVRERTRRRKKTTTGRRQRRSYPLPCADPLGLTSTLATNERAPVSFRNEEKTIREMTFPEEATKKEGGHFIAVHRCREPRHYDPEKREDDAGVSYTL